MKKKHLLVFVFFLTLSIVLRFPTFFQSVIDWDESLYILIGRSLKEGHLPYTEVWDHKPPGIYILFSLALMLFGNSMFAIRFISCIAVTVTCYFLYKTGKTFSKNSEKVGLVSGILYVIFSLTNGGISANTEIFFIPFVTIAFYLLISSDVYPEKLIEYKSLRLFAIGLVIGMGLLIKQLVIFDFLAIIIILGMSLYSSRIRGTQSFITQIIRSYILVAVGTILPFFITVIYYLLNGDIEDFIYANFTANVLRSNLGFSLDRFIKAIVVQTAQYFLLWTGLVLTLLYLALFKEVAREERRKLIAGVIWFILQFLGVCYTRDFWSHYFLQVLPSLCFLSSFIIVKVIYPESKPYKRSRNGDLGTLIFGFALSLYFVLRSIIKTGEIIYFQYVKGINNWGDPTAVVADYVKERVSRKDYIYVVDDQPIIYFLAQAKVPTKFVFPGHLLGEDFAKVAGVNSLQELNSIIQKKPVYILKRGKNVSDGRGAVYTGLDFYIKSQIEGRIAKLTTRQPKTETKIDSPQQKNTTLADKFYANLDTYLKERYIFETSIEGIELYKIKTQENS